MNGKKEFLERLSELGLVIQGPVWPTMFQRSKFRRLVMHSGLGEMFSSFTRMLRNPDANQGAGAPVLRNLHVHNGSGTTIEDVTVNRKTTPAPQPPKVPANGDKVQSEEWAFNDSFDPAGHLPGVSDLTIRMIPTDQPGQVYAGDVARESPDLIETVWVDVRPGLGGFAAEVILWVGASDDNLIAEGPHIIQLDPVP